MFAFGPRLRRGPLGLAVAGAAILSLVTTTAASAAVITGEDGPALAQAMSAVPVSTASLLVDYDCEADLCPTGIGDTPMAGFPTAGGSFGILTSGNAGLADDANSDTGSGEAWGYDGPPIGTVHDQQVVKIDLGAGHGDLPGVRLPVPLRGVPGVRHRGLQRRLRGPAQHAEHRDLRPDVVAPGDFAAGSRRRDLGRRRRAQRDELPRRRPGRRTTGPRCLWWPASRSPSARSTRSTWRSSTRATTSSTARCSSTTSATRARRTRPCASRCRSTRTRGRPASSWSPDSRRSTTRPRSPSR